MKLFFFFFSTSSSSSNGNGNGSSSSSSSNTKHNKKKSKRVRNNLDLFTSPKTFLPSNSRRYSRSPSTSSFSSSSSLQIPTANRISREELESVLRRLCGDEGGEVADLLTEVNEDGMIDLDGITGCTGNADEEELLAAFRVFDSDGDGRISAEELHGAFLMMGDCDCSVEDCRRMIGGVDSDGDGFVSFVDFVRMMS